MFKKLKAWWVRITTPKFHLNEPVCSCVRRVLGHDDGGPYGISHPIEIIIKQDPYCPVHRGMSWS